MPWECIGDVDTQPDSRWEDSWQSFCRNTALQYIEFVCGKPPEGCELGLMYNDHDYGEYISIGVCYEYGYPQDYIRVASQSLETLNAAVDWYKLKVHYIKTTFPDEDEEPDD